MLAQSVVPPQTPAQIADLIVQCLGLGLLIIGGAIVLSKRRAGVVFGLPAQPVHRIEPVHLLLGLLAFFWIPSAVNLLVVKLGFAPPPPTSMPDDWTPPAVQLWVGAIAKLLGILLLIAITTPLFVDGRRGWGLRGDKLPSDIGAAAVTYVAFWPICTGVMYATRAIIELMKPGAHLPDHPSIEILQRPDTPGLIAALTVFEAAVIAPVIEELFFRGMVQPALARWWRSTWAAILFCGLAFGAIHSRNVETVPALALFGIVLGYLYARTRSLTAAILLHMLFNTKTLVWLWMERALAG